MMVVVNQLLVCHCNSWMRLMRGIDKKALGIFLGGRDTFNQDVLRAFASTFDFSSGSFVSCLRQYMTSFLVPGEAQIISRVLEIFAEKYVLYACLLVRAACY
jgi:Sec7-like guanine-nucleotide exchange factor